MGKNLFVQGDGNSVKTHKKINCFCVLCLLKYTSKLIILSLSVDPERRGFCPADAKSVRPLQGLPLAPLARLEMRRLAVDN